MGLLVALATGCGMVGATPASRPANDAERHAAGFDDPQTRVMVRELDAGAARGLRAPTGVSGARYLTRIGTAFSGRTSDFTFSGEPPSMACAAGTSEKFATANLDLPDQAEIRYVDVFGYDNSADEDLRVFLLSLCQSTFESGPPEFEMLGDALTNGTPGDTVTTLDLSAAPVIVDRYSCKYLARVSMATSAGGTCVGGAIFLDKVRIEYTLP
jgi:hypothetical protein